MTRTRIRTGQSGMTLVEVAIATAIFTIASLAAAHLLVWATRTFWATGAESTALAAAQMKMEELQSLAWRFGDTGNRVSDLETNLSGRSPSSGGPGLTASPTNALQDSLDGYADYLDAQGQWVGTGPSPPPDAAFVRRWAVRPLAAAPDDTLILQVLVIPIVNDRAERRTTVRGAGESVLTSARTRVR
jgi:prepilin-type N-terminal cleavage/methylation domain-containing protein